MPDFKGADEWISYRSPALLHVVVTGAHTVGRGGAVAGGAGLRGQG